MSNKIEAARGAVTEDLTGLYTAVGQIVARKYYCEFCAGHRDAALAQAKHGPRAFLMAAANHRSMICGCAEWVIDTAQDAISAQDSMAAAPQKPPGRQ